MAEFTHAKIFWSSIARCLSWRLHLSHYKSSRNWDPKSIQQNNKKFSGPIVKIGFALLWFSSPWIPKHLNFHKVPKLILKRSIWCHMKSFAIISIHDNLRSFPLLTLHEKLCLLWGLIVLYGPTIVVGPLSGTDSTLVPCLID